MTDRGDFTASETAEHLISTTPPAVSNTANVSLPRSEGRRNRSEVWNHFTVDPGPSKRARCNYCSSFIKYDNGTSSMISHTKRCKHNPGKRSASSSTAIAEGQVSSSPSFAKFDQETCRNEMVKMFVAAELPFRLVENEAFQRFLSFLQPRFNPISRITLARDILMLWDIERTKLKKFISQHCRKVCLTTDTWTSCQNMSYMCLTAHFIDNDWILHKKIINFCQVTSHTGEDMAKTVEACLGAWGINQVLSLTVDNASSNDVAIQYLKKRLMLWDSIVLRGDYIHMRCCAHILNLIVKEGLKEIDDSICRIRAAVKYIRSSPLRLTKFKKCVEKMNIEYQGLVCLDVETRWNSTYLMLEAALKLQKAFEELDMKDKKYAEDLNKGKGVPTYDDWEYARLIFPFLKVFYEATEVISGSSYVTSNIYMFEVLGIGKKIREMCQSEDNGIRVMAQRMKKKYDKYWGKPDNLNMLLLIAVVLDPRYKLKFVNWFISQVFDSVDTTYLQSKIESCLKSLFEEYHGGVRGSQRDSQETRVNVAGKKDRYDINLFFQSVGGISGSKSELSQYLEEALHNPDDLDLDVLSWWKINSSRFPILANIAREVLAIPVSTVASEAAFSTGGRVLDSYRSSLTPTMVEALICTQDWLKGTSSLLVSVEDFQQLEKFAQEIVSQDFAAIALDED